MSRAGHAFLVLALILALGACSAVKQIGYQKNGQTVETDYATGDTIITQYWKYDDGAQGVTFKRIPRGNRDMRGEPPAPEARFAGD